MNDFTAFRAIAEGAPCLDLVRQEYRHAGQVTSAANVLFLQIASDRWLRFCLDAGVFFWREVAQPDAEFADPSTTDVYVNLPVAGEGMRHSHVQSVELETVSPGTTVLRIGFATGAFCRLRSTVTATSDAMDLEIGAGVA